MATRNINTFIQHLMNENLAATQAAVTAGTAVKQKKRDDVLSSALGVGVGRIAVNPFTVDKLKKKSPAAAKEFTDSGNYGPKKAGGVRDRMEKAFKSAKDKLKQKTPPSGSMVGY